METIKSTTKQGAHYVARFNSTWNCRNIYEAYKNPSPAKIEAEENCRLQCNRENGWDFKILGHNAQHFTAAWRTFEGIRIETAYNSYLIK